jgi:hypothetical protein
MNNTNQPTCYYWAGNAHDGVTTTYYDVYKRWCEKLLASGEPFTHGVANDPHTCIAALESWISAQIAKEEGATNNG